MHRFAELRRQMEEVNAKMSVLAEHNAELRQLLQHKDDVISQLEAHVAEMEQERVGLIRENQRNIHNIALEAQQAKYFAAKKPR